MNHTLYNKVRCTMLSSSVPKLFRGKAVMTVCHLTTFVALNDDQSYEKWYDKCADYFMLRTFGYTAFSHRSD